MLWRLIVLLAICASSASASPTTIGCVTPGLITTLLAGLGGALGGGGGISGITSASACAARCTTDFAYWSSGQSRCYCSNTGIDIYQLGSSSVTVAQSASSPLCGTTNYQVQALGFPYTLQACAPATEITSTTVSRSNPKTVNECLTACTGFAYAMVGLGSSATCTCGRGTTVSATGATTCAAGRTAIYRNTGVVDPAPSGKKKRRKLAEDRRLCPGRLAACLIAGQDGAFECIDIDAELEACGGCASGAVDGVLDTRIGIDCSAIPGVALGGVTCSNGRCLVSKCKRGWVVVPDKCLKVV